jgi:uncharacterized hydrophobic protein (TIGR00271 family)
VASVNNETGDGHEPSLSDSSLFDQKAIVLQSLREGSEPNLVFWSMNGLGAVIACYGLFANSPAVVIGAMVVATLLGPIAGVSLGLNEFDKPLLGKAFASLMGGVFWIFVISVAIGFIHRDVPLTAEILSRSNPRLFDLMIALAGGAAGAIAVLSPRIGAAVVGVAVATALVPPIAASGIFLARADFGPARDAMLLALTNIVAIQLAFSTVLWMAGYGRLTKIGEQGFLAFLRREIFSLAIVCILAGAFGFQLHTAIITAIFESKVRGVLSQQFDDASGFKVVDVLFSKDFGNPSLTAVIRGPKAPAPEKIAAAQAILPQLPDGSNPNLRVRFIRVLILTPIGALKEGDISEPED